MTQALDFHAALVAALRESTRDCDATVSDEAPGSGGADFDVSVVPADKRCADIRVTVAGKDIDVLVGIGTRIRLTIGRRRSWPDAVAELASVCRALVAGRVSEKVWRRGTEPVGVLGRIELDSSEIKSRWNVLVARIGRPEEVTYEPYPPAA